MSKASKLNRSNNIYYIKQISKDYYSLNFTGQFASNGGTIPAGTKKNILLLDISANTTDNRTMWNYPDKVCHEISTGSIRRNISTTNTADAYIQLKPGSYYKILIDCFDTSYNINGIGRRYLYLQGDSIPGGDNLGTGSRISRYQIVCLQTHDQGTQDIGLSTTIKAESSGRLYFLTYMDVNYVSTSDSLNITLIIQEL